MTVAINSTFQTISDISIDEVITYNPWHDSPDNFCMHLRYSINIKILVHRNYLLLLLYWQ